MAQAPQAPQPPLPSSLFLEKMAAEGRYWGIDMLWRQVESAANLAASLDLEAQRAALQTQADIIRAKAIQAHTQLQDVLQRIQNAQNVPSI